MPLRSIALAIALASMFGMTASAEAKKKPELSSLELQQMQSREIEAATDTVFGAVMTVLQDAGYRIQTADKDTGLISGIGSSKGKLTWAPFVGFGKKKKTPIVSAFVEPYGPNYTRLRLSFVLAKLKSNIYGSQPQDEEPILDPAVYQDAFEKVNRAVFIRQSMAATAPEPKAHTAPAATTQAVDLETQSSVTESNSQTSAPAVSSP